jgi:two-component SAPR family response regulator
LIYKLLQQLPYRRSNPIGQFSFRVHLGLMFYYRGTVVNMEVNLRMKYIIADPDEKSGNDLKRILDEYKILDFKGCFKIFEIAEKSIRKENPDIVFIRIDKIELNAFKLANLIRELNPFSKIIFTSSQAEYAVEAFECEANGFLLIPFNDEKIRNFMVRILKSEKNRQ